MAGLINTFFEADTVGARLSKKKKKLDYFCLLFSLSYKSHVVCISLSLNRLLKKIIIVILISTVDT